MQPPGDEDNTTDHWFFASSSRQAASTEYPSQGKPIHAQRKGLRCNLKKFLIPCQPCPAIPPSPAQRFGVSVFTAVWHGISMATTYTEATLPRNRSRPFKSVSDSKINVWSRVQWVLVGGRIPYFPYSRAHLNISRTHEFLFFLKNGNVHR